MRCEGCEKNLPTLKHQKMVWHRVGDGQMVECVRYCVVDANIEPRRCQIPEAKLSFEERDQRRRRLMYGNMRAGRKTVPCMYVRPIEFDGVAILAAHRRGLVAEIERLEHRVRIRSITGRELARQCRTLRDATVFVPIREGLLMAAQGAEMPLYDCADVTAIDWAATGLHRARRVAQRLAQ